MKTTGRQWAGRTAVVGTVFIALGAFWLSFTALADLAVASPLMNFRHCGACIDAAVHPKIAAWSEAILARPSLAPWVEKEERMMAKVLAA